MDKQWEEGNVGKREKDRDARLRCCNLVLIGQQVE